MQENLASLVVALSPLPSLTVPMSTDPGIGVEEAPDTTTTPILLRAA